MSVVKVQPVFSSQASDPNILLRENSQSSDNRFYEIDLNESSSSSHDSIFNNPENKRLKEDLILYPEAVIKDIKSIPYSWVGRESKHLQTWIAADRRRNYPDWHKITPAYDISFSGMNKKQLAVSLFKLNDPNNFGKRFKRWWNEDKAVIYCNKLDMIASGITLFLLAMTLIVLIWQWYVGASLRFEVDGSTNHKSAKLLNKIPNGIGWKWVRGILTSFSVLIFATNIFKRTTEPTNRVVIKEFQPKVVLGDITDHIVYNPRAKIRNIPMKSSREVVPM